MRRNDRSGTKRNDGDIVSMARMALRNADGRMAGRVTSRARRMALRRFVDHDEVVEMGHEIQSHAMALSNMLGTLKDYNRVPHGILSDAVAELDNLSRDLIDGMWEL